MIDDKNFKFNQDVKVSGQGFFGGQFGIIKNRKTKKDGVYFGVSFKTKHGEIVIRELKAEQLEKYQ